MSPIILTIIAIVVTILICVLHHWLNNDVAVTVEEKLLELENNLVRSAVYGTLEVYRLNHDRLLAFTVENNITSKHL